MTVGGTWSQLVNGLGWQVEGIEFLLEAVESQKKKGLI